MRSRYGMVGRYGASFWLAASLVSTGVVLADDHAHEQVPVAKTFQEQLNVTSVSLLVEARGADGGVPDDLRPEDFVVEEDGVEQTVVSVEPIARAASTAATEPAGPATTPEPDDDSVWEVVVYCDQALTGRRSIKQVAESLRGQAAELIRLGDVRIVAADDGVQEILAPTRDPAILDEGLRELGKKVHGRDTLGQIRRRLLQEINPSHLANQLPNPNGDNGSDAPGKKLLIESSVREEVQLIARQSEALLAWASRERSPKPRVLLLVSDGFDVDPSDFYMALVPARYESRMRQWLTEVGTGQLRDQLTRRLAAQGWIISPLAFGTPGAGFTSTADSQGTAGGRNSTTENIQGLSGLGGLLVPHGLDPLRAHAADTGGQLVTQDKLLPAAVRALADKLRLTYEVSRPPDGRIHEVKVTARRPGLEVKTSRWVASESLEDIAVRRAEAVVHGQSARGDLPLEAVVLVSKDGPDHGTLFTRLGLAPLGEVRAGLSSASMRVSLVVYFKKKPPFVHHQVVTGQDLSAGERWSFSVGLSFPDEVAAVVVVEEELSSGAWGAGTAPLMAEPSS